MLEKKKTNKGKILLMLFLVVAVLAGSSVAYAKIYKGTTIRGWSYTFDGRYNSDNGASFGSTKASFSKHTGCYTEVRIYNPNLNNPYFYGKTENNYVDRSGNVGRNNKNIRIHHTAKSRIGACSAGGHTIY